MGAQGTTTVTFGAWPGGAVATVAVTGQSGILSGSLCEAWLDATQGGTADHTPDEHTVTNLQVSCENIVAGTGFTIVVTVPDTIATMGKTPAANLAYGAWNVTWVWN